MIKKQWVPWAIGGMLAFGLAGGAQADLRVTYSNVGTVVPGSGPAGYSGLNVNRNADSPYYGYVYAAERLEEHKIKIYAPVPASDGSGATAYVDTGKRILPSVSNSTNPWDVFVGPDDTVWIMNLGTRAIDSAPPVPPGADTEVTATRQIDVPTVTAAAGVTIGASGPRGISVTGPVNSAKVYLTLTGTGGGFYQRFSVTGGTQTTAGTATLDWSATGSNLTYGAAVDPAGNSYWPESATPASATVLKKLNADGTVDAGFAAKLPAFFTANLAVADADFVTDPNAPGGGYIVSVHRTRKGTNSLANPDTVSGHRWALDGTWLSGWGPAMTDAPGNYSTVTLVAAAASNTNGSTASAQYFGVDDKGNFYPNFKDAFPGGNGAFAKVAQRAPFVVDAAAAHSATDAVKSSPTAVDGVVYFGSDDGKLYAYTTADGNSVAGFPVDVAAATAPGVKLQGRPAVYYTTAGKGIYFTTDRGDIGRVDADGGNPVFVNLGGLGSGTVSTPAVMADGTVYVSVIVSDGRPLLFRIPADFNVVNASNAPLGLAGSTITSPAVYGNKVYVGVSGGTGSALWVLNASDLAPLATFAHTEDVAAPPYVSGGDAYFGTKAGNFYKVNSATLEMDDAFGAANEPATPGRAAMGEPISTSPFRPNNGPFLVGTDNGKVFSVRPSTGEFSVFYDTGDAASPIGGLVATNDALGFGTSAGAFYVVPPNSEGAQVYRGYGPFSGTPTYDAGTRRFVIGSEDSNVYTFTAPAAPAEM